MILLRLILLQRQGLIHIHIRGVRAMNTAVMWREEWQNFDDEPDEDDNNEDSDDIQDGNDSEDNEEEEDEDKDEDEKSDEEDDEDTDDQDEDDDDEDDNDDSDEDDEQRKAKHVYGTFTSRVSGSHTKTSSLRARIPAASRATLTKIKHIHVESKQPKKKAMAFGRGPIASFSNYQQQ